MISKSEYLGAHIDAQDIANCFADDSIRSCRKATRKGSG